MEVISTSTLPFANTALDKYITFPQLREIYSFKVIDGTRSRRIKQVPQRLWNRIVPAPQEYARQELGPSHYTIWSNTAIIWPLVNRADVAIEAWHTVWPLDFSDSDLTAVSQFNQKDEILIELALVYAFNSLSKQDEAQAHWSRAKPLLAEAMNMDSHKPDLDIDPSLGDQELGQQGLPNDYWTDPFVKEAR
jgi:hypothetical protein